MPVRPSVTVIIGQRERFSGTGAGLAALVADGTTPFDLICLDAGAPPAVRRAMEGHARTVGGTVLPPTAGPAAALDAVGTPWVLLLDDDGMLDPGSLAAMLDRAAAGGADIVLPNRGRRSGAPTPTESERVAGCRCLLVRSEMLRRALPRDPAIGELRRRFEVGLAMRALGARPVVERAARFVAAPEEGYRISDLPLFRRYWEPARVAADLAAMPVPAGARHEPGAVAALCALAERRFAAVVPLLPGFPADAAATPMTVAESVQGGGRLLLLARECGYPESAVRWIAEGHALALRLCDGRYRASGRPLVNHAVGAAGVLVRYRVRPDIVIAALLAVGGDERAIGGAVGDAVTTRVRDHHRWQRSNAAFRTARPDPAEMTTDAAAAILMALARAIDDRAQSEPADAGTLAADVGAYCAATAGALGISGMGATLEHLAATPVLPAALRVSHSGSFRVRAPAAVAADAAPQRAYPIAGVPTQAQADVAVVVPTVMRPALLRAVRSIFDQSFPGTVQLLIGADREDGGLPADELHALLERRPERMGALVLKPGYSTAVRNGGVHPGRGGGAMRTVLSFLANAPLVAYLDDDSWFLEEHLADMAAAVAGFDWAYSMRWFADGEDGRLICPDRWESVGPGKGMYAQISGGLVDTNCFIVDKRRVAEALVAWATGTTEDGAGQDRQFMLALARRHPVGWTGRHSVAYTIRRGSRLWRLAGDPAFHDRLAWAAWRGWTYADTFLRWPDLLRAATDHAREKTAAGVSRDRPP